MPTTLTKSGYDMLCNKLQNLLKVELPKTIQELEDTRPLNGGDEFPIEYIQAIDAQNRVEKKIADIQTVLNDCFIFDKHMSAKDSFGNNKVGFGATVTILDTDTDNDKTYTIVSVHESDIESGLISIQAPFVKEMIGLLEGDSFEFNDKEYIVTSIDYNI